MFHRLRKRWQYRIISAFLRAAPLTHELRGISRLTSRAILRFLITLPVHGLEDLLPL